MGVGSGSHYAIAAARALMTVPDVSAEEVCQRSMDIASDMCVYTNKSFMLEVMDDDKKADDDEGKAVDKE